MGESFCKAEAINGHKKSSATIFISNETYVGVTEVFLMIVTISPAMVPVSSLLFHNDHTTHYLEGSGNALRDIAAACCNAFQNKNIQNKTKMQSSFNSHYKNCKVFFHMVVFY